MPEGDTIFRSALVLHRALAGRVVTRFDTALAHLQRVEDQERVSGRTVDGVTARGKHLIVEFSGGLVLRTHMRMSGSWHLYRPGDRWRRPRRAMRVVIATAEFEAVAFDVQDAEFAHAAELERTAVGRLGPDLLAEDFDGAEAVRRLRGLPPMDLGDAVLDQRGTAGTGNVFKSEVLFLAGLCPTLPLADVTDEELARIVEIARRLLLANVPDRQGTADTGPASRRTTHLANPAAQLWVYGRGGRPCRRCGTPIVYRKQGKHARGSYFCPTCQRGCVPDV